ncbi:hypothetical protein HDU78_006865 [Chytriomyces hyalinus]|nr:hypothetical protein HDU78_006865 [Chytriomyces hyalinus]
MDTASAQPTGSRAAAQERPAQTTQLLSPQAPDQSRQRGASGVRTSSLGDGLNTGVNTNKANSYLGANPVSSSAGNISSSNVNSQPVNLAHSEASPQAPINSNSNSNQARNIQPAVQNPPVAVPAKGMSRFINMFKSQPSPSQHETHQTADSQLANQTLTLSPSAPASPQSRVPSNTPATKSSRTDLFKRASNPKPLQHTSQPSLSSTSGDGSSMGGKQPSLINFRRQGSGVNPPTPMVSPSSSISLMPEYPLPSDMPMIASATADPAGFVFGVTIAEAAARAGKNGIPDIVVQCVEYLERKNLIDTEGLYRIPGSIKRVKEWAAKFDAYGYSSGGGGGGSGYSAYEADVGPSSFSSSAEHLTVPESLSVLTKRSSSLPNNRAVTGVGLWHANANGCPSTPGFAVNLDNETAPTVASLLKKYLSSVKGKFAPPALWEVLDTIALDINMGPPTPEVVHGIRTHIDAVLLSKEHMHTFAYFMLHLHRVQSLSAINLMTPRNLALCIFVPAKEGAEYVVRYADVIFGNVPLVPAEYIELLPKADPVVAVDVDPSGLMTPPKRWLDSPEPGKKGEEHGVEEGLEDLQIESAKPVGHQPPVASLTPMESPVHDVKRPAFDVAAVNLAGSLTQDMLAAIPSLSSADLTPSAKAGAKET